MIGFPPVPYSSWLWLCLSFDPGEDECFVGIDSLSSGLSGSDFDFSRLNTFHD
jgi:hypothetical protein